MSSVLLDIQNTSKVFVQLCDYTKIVAIFIECFANVDQLHDSMSSSPLSLFLNCVCLSLTLVEPLLKSLGMNLLEPKVPVNVALLYFILFSIKLKTT